MIEFLIPEKDLPYDPKDKDSVAEYTKLLENKTLNDFTNNVDIENKGGNKGKFGQKIENIFFLMKTNSRSEADFPDIPLELKTAGLKPATPNSRRPNISGKWKAAQPLPLSSINFIEIGNEDFFSSKFLQKNKNLLCVFYEYEKDKSIYERKIKITGIWSFHEIPESEKKIIMDDWETIKSKAANNQAHNLTRGDGNYLSPGPSGESHIYTKQLDGSKARTRKFNFKASYMDAVIARLGSSNIQTESLYKEGDENISLSEKIYEKFKPYIGMKDKDIAISLGISEQECKQRHSILSKNILKAIFGVPKNINVEEYIDEFSKADVTVKTVKLNENNMPDQNVSFPAFKYKEIYREQWDNSLIKEQIDCKFLFVFFKEIGNECFLDSISYWNMPIEDLEEVKKVWKKTKECVKTGKIVKEIKKIKNGVIRLNHFPKKTESRIAHIRPHGTNKKETYDLPVPDILTEATSYTKQCIWLNNNYIRDNIYLKKIENDI
tara:strand:+ start:42 stop:1520 length:1479 start_codon:yes stop_codon:yes gene_type:complete